MERELGLLKYVDFIQRENFEFLFEPKQIQRYEEELIKPLLVSEQHVGEKWDELRVMEALKRVLEASEEIARENGYSSSIRQKSNRISLVVMVALIGGSLALTLLFGNLASYVLFPILLVYCFLPRMVNQRLRSRWLQFKAEHYEEFRSKCAGELDRLHEFAQFLIDDLRDVVVAVDFPLDRFPPIPLLSNDYDHLQFRQEVEREGSHFYIYQFAPPPGYVPPVQHAVAGEDDQVDEFAVVQVHELTDQFAVKKFEFAHVTPGLYPQVNDLLDHSSFEESEAANVFFNSIDGNDRVRCQCGEVIRLEDGHLSVWKKDKGKKFKFFFGTGVTCSCGRKTYLLSARPGDVPEKLRPIFSPKSSP
ncbi:MAG: hypothetical protein Kow0069_15240 [Promethearchaeota archaeon]